MKMKWKAKVKFATATDVVYDVLGVDHDIPADPNFTHTITLCPHDVKFGRRLTVDAEVKAASFHEAVEKIKEEYGKNIEIVGIEKKEEDHITILGKLLELLVCTRAGEDLLDLELEETSQGEFVYAVFKNKTRKRINVTADSGLMMIIDIVKALM